jgi:hypothetical protein
MNTTLRSAFGPREVDGTASAEALAHRLTALTVQERGIVLDLIARDGTMEALMLALLVRFAGKVNLDRLPAEQAMAVLDGLNSTVHAYNNEFRNDLSDEDMAVIDALGDRHGT